MRQVDHFIVEVAALLHDIYDHKYTAESSGTTTDQQHFLERFLCNLGLSNFCAQQLVRIIQAVGYTKQLSRERRGESVGCDLVAEYNCVQDADFLDAIGAIGILRTSAFSGVR